MEIQENFPDCLAVQEPVDRLVRVAEQAVIASRLADFRDACCVAFIFAGIRIEVTDAQRFTSHRRESLWVFEQSAENTGTALGRFIKQDVAWLFPIWQQLRSEER